MRAPLKPGDLVQWLNGRWYEVSRVYSCTFELTRDPDKQWQLPYCYEWGGRRFVPQT